MNSFFFIVITVIVIDSVISLLTLFPLPGFSADLKIWNIITKDGSDKRTVLMLYRCYNIPKLVLLTKNDLRKFHVVGYIYLAVASQITPQTCWNHYLCC